MAQNLEKVPVKGILKNSSSFENQEKLPKGTKWDEMNILATHHPKDKDYGHMKIEEPKTPYNYYNDGSGDEADSFDVNLLTQKIKLGSEELPKVMKQDSKEESESEEEEETNLAKEKRMAFESKRKNHYNEFAAVKLARKLMEQDDEEEEASSKDQPEPENGTPKSDL